MNPLFKDFEGAPWLIHNETPPSKETAAAIEKMLAEEAKYPMAPGNELEFLDDSTPANITREDIKTSTGRQLYFFTPKNLPATEKRIIYYIHGGAFMRGNGKFCRFNAIHQVRHLGLPVCACEHKYIPEFRYPEHLNDVVNGWDYLVDDLKIDPANISVIGESSGGTLAMALCVRLQKQGRTMPRNMILLSGYLDMTLAGESYTKNFGVDPLFSFDLHPFPLMYADENMLNDPEVSPMYSDMKDFPPICFTVDDTEVFLSDSLKAADKLHKQGIKTKAMITHGFIHVFLFEAPDMPESVAMFKAIKDFISN
jgi:acetyl esterase/lipase